MRAASALVVALVFAPAAASEAPPTLETAERLLDAGDLDAIYLAFATLKPGEHPEGDAAAAALISNAARTALTGQDAPLSIGLAEIARRLDPTSAEAALAFAAAALALEQRGAAADALDTALQHDPQNGDLLFERASLSETERDLERAHTLYGQVPRRHPRSREARAGARRMAEARQEQARALKAVGEIESDLQDQQQAAGRRLAQERAGGDTTAPPGMTARESRRFRIAYHRGDRDFAERADFEVRVMGLFEDAHQRVSRLFDYEPPEPVDVVLYTREEFQREFGGRFGQGVLGFYAGKIRMNRAEDPRDPQFRRTVIHEYVHAVVDQMAGGNAERVPTWINEGLAVWAEHSLTRTRYGEDQTAPERLYWQRQAQAIPLETLAAGSFAHRPQTRSAYMKSWAAVTALVGTGGNLRLVLRIVEETGAGRSFEESFVDAFGQSRLDRLDEEANRILAR